MRTKLFKLEIDLLTLAEFAEKHPSYSARATGPGRPLFDVVMTPSSFLLCAAITEVEQAPAIKALASRLDDVAKERRKPLDDGERQLCGMLVKALMEANGYKRTGQKARVGISPFSRGAIYERLDGVTNPVEA